MSNRNNDQKNEDRERHKNKLVMILMQHVGRTRMIGMAELFMAVFDRPVQNRINDTRLLRTYITELRKDGIPICSVSSVDGAGYYVASASSELDDYCSRLKTQALKKLAQVARLKKIGLPALVGEIQMNLGMEVKRS